VVPVKSEPGALVPESQAMTPSDQYGGQLSDPASMDYGEEYVDYEGVYDGDGSYEGSSGLDHSLAGGADGNKGRKLNLLGRNV
jgi:hypothetical protein